MRLLRELLRIERLQLLLFLALVMCSMLLLILDNCVLNLSRVACDIACSSKLAS